MKTMTYTDWHLSTTRKSSDLADRIAFWVVVVCFLVGWFA